LIRLREVSFAFPLAGARDVLRQVSLDVPDGQWVAITGGNGSGKTTLCRLMAGIDRPRVGTIEVDGMDPARARVAPRGVPPIGIAFQNPDSQFVTSSAARELLFGMENLALEADERESRCAAAARSFSLEPYLARNPHTLSGGEKQRLLLACLWAMGPRHLILDEPFSFLDLQGSASFLEALRDSFRREGKTIVWSTVDAGEMALADRVIYLERGAVRFDGAPGDLFRSISQDELERSLVHRARAHGSRDARMECERRDGSPVVEIDGACFAPGGSGFVLEVPCLSVASGERVGLCGASGSGKTTLLLACAGLLPPRSGAVTLLGASIRSRRDFPAGKVAFLFQSPEEGFFAPTVREEVALAHRSFSLESNSGMAVSRAIAGVGLSPEMFLERNPFHLSQGEKRLVALASVLVLEAGLVLLDEPTIFLDGGARRLLRSALEALSARGATVIIASHDAAFLRECTDRIVTLDSGRLT